MTLLAKTYTADDFGAVQEFFHSRKWTDGLPVVPPTEDAVQEMLDWVVMPADQLIGIEPVRERAITTEKLAINAVMAGCEPAMMRALIPLVRAMCDERFDLHGLQATTHSAMPLIVVNGPIRDELGFNYGAGVFSNSSRANSSLGRTFRLLARNLGGALPGEIDMSTMGSPGHFCFCIAEHEAAVREHHLEAALHEQVVAVGGAAERAVGDAAAHRVGAVRVGVHPEGEAVGRESLAERVEGDARLDEHRRRIGVEIDDAVHAAEIQEQRTLRGIAEPRAVVV